MLSEKERIDKERKAIRLSEEQIAVWFHQLLEALSHIHTLNILHRDIKPSNILVSEDLSKVFL